MVAIGEGDFGDELMTIVVDGVVVVAVEVAVGVGVGLTLVGQLL